MILILKVKVLGIGSLSLGHFNGNSSVENKTHVFENLAFPPPKILLLNIKCKSFLKDG